jgi:ribosomal protein L32
MRILVERRTTMDESKEKCPHCGESLDGTGTICGKCGFQRGDSAALATAPSPIRGRIQKRMVPDGLAVCLDVDATGSSQSFEGGIKGNIPLLIDGIIAEGVKNARFSILEHRDEDYGERPILYPETSDPEEVKRIVREMKFQGGGDAPETHLQAAEKALREVAWSNKRSERNIYVAFWNADAKPLKGGTVSDLANSFRSPAEGTHRLIDVILVAQSEPMVKEFADAVGAEFIPISTDPTPDEMKRITGRLVKSISCATTKVPTRTGTRVI